MNKFIKLIILILTISGFSLTQVTVAQDLDFGNDTETVQPKKKVKKKVVSEDEESFEETVDQPVKKAKKKVEQTDEEELTEAPEKVSTKKKSGLQLIKVIDGFEQKDYGRTYWWGSGDDAEVNVTSVKNVGQIGKYAMKIDYSINSYSYDNWISISRNFSAAEDFSDADGISFWIKGSGGEGSFGLLLRDKNGVTMEYNNLTVLDNNKWSKIMIPFNLCDKDRKWQLSGAESLDLSKITDVEFMINIPERTPREVPITGVCYIDQMELVSGLITIPIPIFTYIPNGYSMTEYYEDPETGQGIYQSLNFSDKFYFTDKFSLSLYLKAPSKYVISGYKPPRIIDWIRGDDLKILNQPEYSITIPELYLLYEQPTKYITNFRLGTTFMQWNPWLLHSQSKNMGILVEGTIGKAGDYESFIGADYWQRLFLFGSRFKHKYRKSLYVSPMLILAQQTAKYKNQNIIRPLADYVIYGIEIKNNLKEFSSLALNRINLGLTYSNMTESSYGQMEKESPWNKELDYNTNLRNVYTGGVIITKEYPQPIIINDQAIVAEAKVGQVSDLPVGFVVEGRYIGKYFGGTLIKDSLLPWLKNDEPNLLAIERRTEVSVLQKRYAHTRSGYLDGGYVDQTGGNLRIFINRGRKIESWLEGDYAYRVSNLNINDMRAEAGIGYAEGEFKLMGLYGLRGVTDKGVNKSNVTYYELNGKIRPVGWLDLELVGGYRSENRTIFSPLLKNMYFAQLIFKPIPIITFDFKIKKSQPQESEYGGTAAEVREGDYRVWSDQSVDDYIYCTMRIDF